MLEIAISDADLLLKKLALADFAKKERKKEKEKRFFCMNVYCFMCDYYVAFISALVLLKCGNLRITAEV